MADALQDGTILCNLLNKVQPLGSEIIVYRSKPRVSLWMLENIHLFLQGCLALGVHKSPETLFEPLDLFEKKNMPKVTLAS